MTTKEAIKILSREKECVQQALQRCADGSGYVSPDGMIRAADYVEACSVALQALLAQQEREDPKPLTLDELRQMDGEPVWIVEGPEDWGHWELSSDAEDYLEGRDADFYSMRYNDPAGRYGLHKLGWLAYRHKPKEEPHE